MKYAISNSCPPYLQCSSFSLDGQKKHSDYAQNRESAVQTKR